MANYKSYTHVERLESDECDGLLESSPVFVTAKIDGTNACVYVDNEGNVCGGSRKRELSIEKDNDNFFSWLQSEQDEAKNLRRAVIDNPNWIIYGEWLGFNKFIGHIKTYDIEAKTHMYIFDVYDVNKEYFLPELEWREALKKYNLEEYYVALLAVLDNPSYKDVVNIAKENKFLLKQAEHVGEGVVCKAPAFRNKYGRNVYGKIVLDEFKERMKQTNKKKNCYPSEGLEKEIVEYWVTEAEMTKSKAKVCVALNAEEFDKKSGKFIGFFLNMIWEDLLTEMKNICKMYKNPVIDFKRLRDECNAAGRKFLGFN